MRVIFYSFPKKENSTKVPSESGQAYDVQLKDRCTIINPVLIMQDNPVSFNYVYIPAFARYYFVSNWSYIIGRWEITLNIDVLASFKAAILEQSCNILYADDSDKNIIDQRIPVKADVAIHKTDKALDGFTITGYDNQGAVILGVTGVGSFGVYLMQDSTLVSELLDGVDDYWDDSLDSVKQFFFGGSAAQNLKSAIALPVLISGSDVGQNNLVDLRLGRYPAMDNNRNNIKGYKINKPIFSKSTEVSIPWQYSDWRNNPPYTEVYIYLPLIGLVALPTADLINDNALIIQYSLNVTSGDLSVQIKGKQTSRIFTTASGNIAMAIAYGSAGISLSKITTAVTAGAGAVIAGASTLATGGAIIPGLLGLSGGLAAAASGTVSGLAGNSSGSGGLGGGSTQGLDRVIHVYVVTRELSDTQSNFNTIMGKPYFGVSKPKNFSGFVMTEGFSIDEGLSTEERLNINRLMDRGVYIE